LLREYARCNSEEAFGTLVSRYVNLVYSVALRQVRDPHLAGEITQAVFIILARKANSLGDKIILSGWLCRTARYASANALTIQRRRQRREQEAYMQNTLDGAGTVSSPPHAEVWNEMAPLLDSALAKLGRKDHDALVLRFFENKNFAEVGAALGASEDAAKMRVNRALEKLRKFFTKRGVSSTTAILAGTISANSVQAAPVALAKSVTVVAVAKGSIAVLSTLTLVKATMKTMTWLKIKAVIILGTTSLIVGGTAVIAFSNTNEKPVVQPKVVSSTRHETTVIGFVNVDDYKAVLLEFRDWFPNRTSSMTSRTMVSEGQSFEDKMIKDAHVKIEIVGINYTNGIIEARENGEDMAYHFKTENESEGLNMANLRLNDSGLGAIFDLYAAISGRTLLVHPAANKKNPVMVATNPHNKAEVIQSLENVLNEKDFAVIPDGNKFEQIIPNKMTNSVNPHSPAPISPHGKDDMFGGSVNFENVPFEQIRAIYAQLSGREIFQEPGLPAITMSLKTGNPLTKPELLYAMDVLLGWQGVKIVNVDEKTSKAIRVQPEN
jgi:RNA polymerase sigma factor (sigma-70 family)